jgi:DnaJ-class molecular chaperone
VPVGLDRLVIDLLAKDPARRPADAAMVQERLRVIGDERVSAARRRRRRPPTVASAPRAGHDVETDVTLSFREAVEGATVPIRLKMQDVMPVRTWRVRFPAGIADGQRVRLKGKGMPGMDGGPDGDLYVVMHVSPHPVFGRSGEDLTSTVPITAEEARTGAEIAVPVLTHPFRVTLRIPAGTPDGQVFRLPGCGVTRREGGAGAMLVTVQVLHGLANVPGGGPAARMDLIQRAGAD